MPRLQLNLGNLNELDRGKAAAAFLHALRMAAQDVVDRAGDKAKRKATLKVELTPMLCRDTGCLKNIAASFKISCSVPDRQTVEYPMNVTADGILHFESMSPFDPDQPELPMTVPGRNTRVTEDGEVVEDDGDQSETEQL